ncbi:MAG: HAD-IC family P-type ATPase, partial [Patescibacteria group bacterium]
SVVVKKDDRYFVYTKGAPEFVLNVCKTTPQEVLQATHAFATQALRTLGFAYKELSAAEYEKQKDNHKLLESDLTFVGLQGMIDPARTEVKPLIESCQQSGISVIMITGDHIETAKAVALEIGITGEALAGEALEKMTDVQFAATVENVHVYARVNPATKMRIVAALQEKGHIVAMTGDGVNDAPALKKADIGIAMGITGTDVAKEASDMVLLDDKFSTIIAAIEEGRGIFHNIRKFVIYLLSCNIAEVVVVFIGVVILQELVLTATILLWINVVTDGFPALALGLDPAEKGILRYNPQTFQTEIIKKNNWIEMLLSGVLLGGLIIMVYLVSLPQGTLFAQGAAFSALVLFEMVMLYVIRSGYRVSFFSNKWLLLSVLGTILLQVVILYTPVLRELFAVGSISLTTWLLILVAAVWLWLACVVLHRLFVPFLSRRGLE